MSCIMIKDYNPHGDTFRTKVGDRVQNDREQDRAEKACHVGGPWLMIRAKPVVPPAFRV